MAADGWTLTNHAKKRRKQMGVTEHRIARAIRDADHDYCQTDYGQDHRVAQHDDIAVVYNPAEGTVITVLWRTNEKYTRPTEGPDRHPKERS